MHCAYKQCIYIVTFCIRMFDPCQKRFAVLKAIVNFKLSTEGNNWNCLMYSNSKIWKYSIFTFIFRVLDTNPLYWKTNQTFQYELLIGERQFDELCLNGLLIAEQNIGPNFNTKITVYWKCIDGRNENIYIFPKWLPGMLNNRNLFHFYIAMLHKPNFLFKY